MKYRVYKEGNYLFFEELDNNIVYTGPHTEVKIISIDTSNENFTVNGTSPMFPNPLKFSEVYKKNLEKYSKQEWVKFYTSESNYIPTDGFTGTMDDIVDGSTYVKTENNYTDAEKTKLSGIEPFAEANNISDSDALELTDGNDTTLHFHASDRNRANHTGTQTSSTISDFGTGVQNSSLSGYTLGANAPISNLDDVKGAFGKAQAQINSKENSSNKTGTVVGNEASTTLFAHVKGMVDWVTLLFVPKTRNITINGDTKDLSSDRSWTIPATAWGSIGGTLSSQTDLYTVLKSEVLTVDFMTGLIVEVYAPNDLKINSVSNVVNAPTVTILVGGSPYTLGSTITSGSLIKISVSTYSVVNLNILNL